MSRIPVIILAGFLGSGKTTLLNHLLRNRRGIRIGAVVNNFGSIEIDALAVAGQVDSMVSLGNGCLCCAVDTEDLDEMLARLARPSAGIDLIVVEASGLAEPQTLIRMILSSSQPRIVYGGLVEVVDAAEFPATRERHPELDRHLAVADLVVMNKADRVAQAERAALLRTLEGLAEPAPVVTAAYGRIDPGLLFDQETAPRPEEKIRQLSFEDLCVPDEDGPDAREHVHLHSGYQSVEFTADEPLSPRRFLAFLDSRPPGLYRIKGTVHFGAGGEGERYALHTVGRFLRFYPGPWPRGVPRQTRLVMIGAGLDAPALRRAAHACVGAGPEESGPGSMYGVSRFTDRTGEDPLRGDPDGEPADEDFAEADAGPAPGA